MNFNIKKILFLMPIILLFGCSKKVEKLSIEEKKEIEEKVYLLNNVDDNGSRILKADGTIILQKNPKEYKDEYDNVETIGIIYDENFEKQKGLFHCLSGRKDIVNEEENLLSKEEFNQYTIFDINGENLGIEYYGEFPKFLNDKLFFVEKKIGEIDSEKLYYYDFEIDRKILVGKYNKIKKVDDVMVASLDHEYSLDENGSFCFLKKNGGKIEHNGYTFDCKMVLEDKVYYRMHRVLPGDNEYVYYNLADSNYRKIFAEDIPVNKYAYQDDYDVEAICFNDLFGRSRKKIENNYKIETKNIKKVFYAEGIRYYILGDEENYFIMDENKTQYGGNLRYPINIESVKYDKLEEVIFSTHNERNNKTYFHIVNDKLEYFNNANWYTDKYPNAKFPYGYYLEKLNGQFFLKNINNQKLLKKIEADIIDFYRVGENDILLCAKNNKKIIIPIDDNYSNVFDVCEKFKNCEIVGDYFVVICDNKTYVYDENLVLYKTFDKKYDYAKTYEYQDKKMLCLFINSDFVYSYDLFDEKFNLKIANSDMPDSKLVGINGNKAKKFVIVSSENGGDELIDYDFNVYYKFRNQVNKLCRLKKNNKIYYYVNYLSKKGATIFNSTFEIIEDFFDDVSDKYIYDTYSDNKYYSDWNDYDSYLKNFGIKNGYKLMKNNNNTYSLVDEKNNRVVADGYNSFYDFNDEYFSYLIKGKEYGIMNYKGKIILKFNLKNK